MVEEQLVRMVKRVGSKPKMEVPMYEINLNFDELLDWINILIMKRYKRSRR